MEYKHLYYPVGCHKNWMGGAATEGLQIKVRITVCYDHIMGAFELGLEQKPRRLQAGSVG